MKKKKLKNKITQSEEWTSPELRDFLSYEYMGKDTLLHPYTPLVDQIKWKLCAQIVRYHLMNEISQNELAQKLGVDAPEMSRLLHYKIERYTIDRLIRYVEILYPKLSVEVTAA